MNALHVSNLMPTMQLIVFQWNTENEWISQNDDTVIFEELWPISGEFD